MIHFVHENLYCAFKGSTELYIMHYSNVAIILFNTDLCKFAFPTYYLKI